MGDKITPGTRRISPAWSRKVTYRRNLSHSLSPVRWITPVVTISAVLMLLASGCASPGREYNGEYTGQHLNRVAFPIGAIGAGMVCLEGTGAISHVSEKKVDKYS